MLHVETTSLYHTRRAKGLCGRHGCAHYSGSRSLCPVHLEAQRGRTGRRYDSQRPNRVLLNLAGIARDGVVVFCAALCLLASPTRADEAPAPQSAANAVEVMNRWCAIEGEPVEVWIERLETALRLAKATKRVNTQAGRRRK